MSGIIDIDEKYCVVVDEYNYALKKKRTVAGGKNGGKEYYESIGYFPSLVQALERYGQENVRERLENGRMTLSDALTAISEATAVVADRIQAAVPKMKVVFVEDEE